MPSVLALALLVAATTARPAAAQPAPPDVRDAYARRTPPAFGATAIPQDLREQQKVLTRLAPYLAAVEKYRTGDCDGAVAEFNMLLRRQVEQDVDDLRNVNTLGLLKPCSRKRGDISYATIQAAALLHTDVALANRKWIQSDWLGRNLGWAVSLLAMIEVDAEALRRVGRKPPCFDDGPVSTRDWHLALAQILLGYWMSKPADQLIDRALAVAPTDPEVLLTAGTIKEALAFERTVTEQSRTAQGDGKAVSIREAAEPLYRRALEVAPGLVEAHLRLGRVLALNGHPEAAEPELVTVVSTTMDRRPLYLGYLFLGALYDSQSRPEDAVASYRTAVALEPLSQPARIGLSLALARAADASGARATALEFLGLPSPPDTVGDGWWGYRFGHFQQGLELLNRLRQAVVWP